MVRCACVTSVGLQIALLGEILIASILLWTDYCPQEALYFRIFLYVMFVSTMSIFLWNIYTFILRVGHFHRIVKIGTWLSLYKAYRGQFSGNDPERFLIQITNCNHCEQSVSTQTADTTLASNVPWYTKFFVLIEYVHEHPTENSDNIELNKVPHCFLKLFAFVGASVDVISATYIVGVSQLMISVTIASLDSYATVSLMMTLIIVVAEESAIINNANIEIHPAAHICRVASRALLSFTTVSLVISILIVGYSEFPAYFFAYLIGLGASSLLNTIFSFLKALAGIIRFGSRSGQQSRVTSFLFLWYEIYGNWHGNSLDQSKISKSPSAKEILDHKFFHILALGMAWLVNFGVDIGGIYSLYFVVLELTVSSCEYMQLALAISVIYCFLCSKADLLSQKSIVFLGAKAGLVIILLLQTGITSTLLWTDYEGRLRPNSRLCLKRHLCPYGPSCPNPRSSPYLMDTYCLRNTE